MQLMQLLTIDFSFSIFIKTNITIMAE